MKLVRNTKYKHHKGINNTVKKFAITLAVAGGIVITLNGLGIFDYLEAKSVELVSLKEEIKYEELRNLDVIEVETIDDIENDLYLVQVYSGITKIKYYDVETKEKLFELDKDGIFSYDTHYEELNGKIVCWESFYKYVNAVDTLKGSYTNSELMQIWDKTKEHYQNMKRVDTKKEKQKEFYKYGYNLY